MPKRKYSRLSDLAVDDPAEVERIDRMMADAAADISRRQGPKKRRPSGGRMIEFWTDSLMQAQLEARNPDSPSVVAIAT